MIKNILCQDKYEAIKLSSLIFIKKGCETFIEEVINVIGNEIIISLKDKSAHSVVLKDREEVETFTDFIQSVCEGIHKISDINIHDAYVEITKN